MVNLVKWEVYISAMQVVVNLSLSVVALALLIEMTLLMGVLFMYVFKKFRKPDRVYILG